MRSRLGTVRVRTTVGAVLALAAVTLLGAFVLVRQLRDALEDDVEIAASLRADEAVRDLESGVDPDRLALDGGDDLAIQVLDGDEVVASSAVVEGEGPLARPEPGESETVDVPFDDDEFLAVSAPAQTDDAGRLDVVVAQPLESVTESTSVVTQLLTVALPVLLIVVGLITWVVVGRALAPVETMRREVDAISAAELHRRIPTPASHDEIAGLAATMNRMLGRLDRSQAQQRRFVSDASHELRSPVASIRQHAEVALAHPDRTTLRDLAENVLAEDLRVQHLVDDLLLLARADEHALGLAPAPLDLDDVVFEEANRLRSTASPRLRVDTTAVSAARVDGDAPALRRVVRNLADNAAHHAHGRVAFSLGTDNGHAVLHVDDDGEGVPEPDRERVFERFVRLDQARARSRSTPPGNDVGGAGLGLAIVAELVRAHGGTVTVGTNPAAGARVTVKLPATFT